MRAEGPSGRSEVGTTLGIKVLGRLRRDLKANRFKPGERLHFGRMKEIYDVGVAPLREALSRLTEAGLVVQVGQKGFRAAPASLKDLKDIVEARRFLEVKVFQEAVRHGGEEWEGKIVASFYALSKASRRIPESPADRALWEARHSDFHAALMSGCPSRWLLQLWSVVFDQAERYRRLAIAAGDWSQDEAGDHKRLLDVALDRDVARAGDLLHGHIGVSAMRLMVRIGPALLETTDASARKRPVAKTLSVADQQNSEVRPKRRRSAASKAEKRRLG